jgi:CRP-like cAMP-binding protein
VLGQSSTDNQLLANLKPAEFALLQPDLERVELPLRRQLELRGRPIEYVYFLESGLASMVASASAHHSVEVGIIGKEGMTGLPLLMGVDHATQETFIQTAGTAQRIAAPKFRKALDESHDLHCRLLRFAHTLFTQMACTALANGSYNIGERLARWLLMADDRAGGAPLHLTHEFLALMLGSRRAGVTVALGEFQKRGVIEVKRGVITLKDRGALHEAANGSYGLPEAEYKRLFAN